MDWLKNIILKDEPKKIKVNTKVAKSFIFEGLKETYQFLTSDAIGRDLINTFSMDKLIALNFLTIYISAKNEWGTSTTSRIISSMIKKMESLYNNDSLAVDYSHKTKLKEHYFNCKKLYSKSGEEVLFTNLFDSKNPETNKNLKKYFKMHLELAQHMIDLVAKY